MPKFVKYFLTLVVFVFGFSMGIYLGIDKEVPVKQEQNKNDMIPVQDVVIRNLQEKINELEKKEPTVVETIVEETKLSPYAKMKIEKKFKKCGHTTVEIKEIPLELINMTESEIIQKYSDWEVRSFSSDEVYLYREIDANCNDHFVLKEKDGFLAVYQNLGEDMVNLKEVTEVEVKTLPEEDVIELQKGILVYGQDTLLGLLEDFGE